jgi:hypothetical protein
MTRNPTRKRYPYCSSPSRQNHAHSGTNLGLRRVREEVQISSVTISPDPYHPPMEVKVPESNMVRVRRWVRDKNSGTFQSFIPLLGSLKLPVPSCSQRTCGGPSTSLMPFQEYQFCLSAARIGIKRPGWKMQCLGVPVLPSDCATKQQDLTKRLIECKAKVFTLSVLPVASSLALTILAAFGGVCELRVTLPFHSSFLLSSRVSCRFIRVFARLSLLNKMIRQGQFLRNSERQRHQWSQPLAIEAGFSSP